MVAKYLDRLDELSDGERLDLLNTMWLMKRTDDRLLEVIGPLVKNDNISALKLYAKMLSAGRGVEKDVAEAGRYADLSLQKGAAADFDACSILMASGVPEMQAKAFEIASRKYDAVSSDRYGMLVAQAYIDGTGVGEDRRKGLSIMKRIADKPGSRYKAAYKAAKSSKS